MQWSTISPAIWQQFIDNVFENIPNKERYKLIMDTDMVLLKNKLTFWRLGKPFQSIYKIWIENLTL